MPEKIRFIFNPMANLGRAKKLSQPLQSLTRKLGGDWVETRDPKDASTLAFQAAVEGFDRVVAVGGDGTVHEVVNGLMKAPIEKRPVMGVVPVGSGNDYFSTAGAGTDPEAAIRQAITGKPQKIDLGKLVTSDGQSEYWINTVGIGFDTIVTIRSRQIPLLQGFSVYLASVLEAIVRDYHPFTIKVTTDEQTWEDELLMLVLCNGNREGGGFKMTANGRTDDGCFEYVGVRRVSRLGMLLTLPHFLDGTQLTLKHVFAGEFRKLEITSSDPLYIHTDGEIISGFKTQIHRLSVELLQGELQVVH